MAPLQRRGRRCGRRGCIAAHGRLFALSKWPLHRISARRGRPANPWVSIDGLNAWQWGSLLKRRRIHRRGAVASARLLHRRKRCRPGRVEASSTRAVGGRRRRPGRPALRAAARGRPRGRLRHVGRQPHRADAGREALVAVRLARHCLAHLEEDLVTCVGPTATSLNGDSLDGIKLSLARWVIGWKLKDPTWQGHSNARIAVCASARHQPLRVLTFLDHLAQSLVLPD